MTMRLRERTYSLLWLLDKTKTAMGGRFLKESIENPLTDEVEIKRRYSIIEKLLTEFILREDLRNALSNVYDLERLSSRICYGNLNARDLIQLKTTLKALPEISNILTELKYGKNIETLDGLYNLLSSSINETPPLSIKEGSLIKEGYSKELDELRSISSGSKDFILNLEQEERERTGIKNLRVGFNKVFMDIRDKVREYIPTIQAISKVIAEVDMMVSLAVVAEENNYVKPVINHSRIVDIREGRHPVVEHVNKSDYVPNDIVMKDGVNILLITGPNMAGKSTYMRQFAIIVIMAQMGSFVPAKSCNIPIFDRIFTRIGASDDLVSGDSTFMIEMKEANMAISEATENSLILFDELGRGTATYDGMSLAQAILEYIHDKIKAKTLFSTHYHELTSLSGDLRNLRNVHVSAVEEDGKITFLHKVKMGAVDRSYGIHVASLAHLPKSLIDRASEILSVYENKNNKKQPFTQTTLFLQPEEEPTKESKIEEELKQINPLEVTPIEALNILYKLKQELEDKNK